MANTIIIKRSSVASDVPVPGDLAEGELAIATNPADRKLYSKDSGGTVFEVGTTDHTVLSNIGTNTHAQIDTHIGDATIHFTEASIDHGSIAGLSDNDHTQYPLKAGTESISGAWTFEAASGSSYIRAQKATAFDQAAFQFLQEGGIQRWIVGLTSTTDDDFFVCRYDGAGTFVDCPIYIASADGIVDIDNGLTVAGDADVTGNIIVTGTVDGRDISGITATNTELNLLDLAGLTAGWALIADSATTASWQALPSGVPTYADTGFEIRSAGNTDSENRILELTHSDSTIRGSLGYEANDDLWLRNRINGGELRLFANDIGGTQREFLRGRPDSTTTITADTELLMYVNAGSTLAYYATSTNVSMLYAGAGKLDTLSTGIQVKSSASNDTTINNVQFSWLDNSIRGYMGYTTTDGSMRINNLVAAADIRLTPATTGDVYLGTMRFDADQTIGAGQDNYVLTYDNAAGKISLEAAAAGGADLTADETVSGTWTLDGPVTAADFGTGGKVKDGLDNAQPIGFNVMPVYEIDVDDTFDLAHNGMLWHRDAGTTVNFTCDNDANIPVGATYVVHNEGTDSIEITAGTASVQFIQAGAAPVSGSVTVDQGGLVTVYKYADGEFWVWGDVSAVPLASLGDLNDVTLTTPADASLLIYDTGTAQWRDFVMSGDATMTDAGVVTVANNSHTHTLSNITDVTATATEVNLLDLAGLTAGWVLSADTANTASWKASTAATELNGLSDVTITSVADDNILIYDNVTAKWRNYSMSGDIDMSDVGVVTAQASIITGKTAAGALVGTDDFLVNDGGILAQCNLSDIQTYMQANLSFQASGNYLLDTTDTFTGTLTVTGTVAATTLTGAGSGITSLTAANISAGNLANGVVPYILSSAASNSYKIPFLNTTGGTAGNHQLYMDTGASPTYNPSTNVLTATNLAGAGASITSLTAANISSGNLGSGVLPYTALQTGSANYKIPFLNTTGATAGNFALQMDNAATMYFNPSSNTFFATNVTGTNIGGITQANLVDKSANEVVSGEWSVPSKIRGKVANYTLVLGDAGQTVRFTGSTAAQTFTIPANASVAFPIGTMIGFENDGSVSISLAITTDTLTWSKDNTTGTRTLAAGASAVIKKTTSTTWKVSGSALVS